MKHVYIVETFKDGNFLGLKVFASKKSAKKYAMSKGLLGHETSIRKDEVSK